VPLCYTNLLRIEVESYNPGLAEWETEIFLKHGLEDGSGYPLSVDEDGAWHTGVHRFQKVPGAFRDNDDVVVAL
jgi:hypothetical protein